MVTSDLHLKKVLKNLNGGLVVIVRFGFDPARSRPDLYLKMKPRLCDCDECRVRGSVIDMIVIDTDHLQFNLEWPNPRSP